MIEALGKIDSLEVRRDPMEDMTPESFPYTVLTPGPAEASLTLRIFKASISPEEFERLLGRTVTITIDPQ